MSVHLFREIENLRKHIVDLSTVVEETVQQAVKALMQRDAELARTLIQRDEDVDRLEVELEEECLKILALYQPVAGDLRYIIAVLKINNDLERISDLAINTAERIIDLQNIHAGMEIPIDFSLMADKTKTMLKSCLDALINYDPREAYQVCQADDEVDQMHREVYDVVDRSIRKNPDATGFLIRLLGISRNFERIADHCTNIAEDVMYLIDGEIIRHRYNKYESYDHRKK